MFNPLKTMVHTGGIPCGHKANVENHEHRKEKTSESTSVQKGRFPQIKA
jgi:hypothetical protein